MRHVEDPARFLVAPVGSWTVLSGAIVVCATPALLGIVCWGTLQARLVIQLIRLVNDFRTGAPCVDVYVDARRVNDIMPEASERLFEWTIDHRDKMSTPLGSRVVVVPPHLAAIAKAGVGISAGGLDDVRLASQPRTGLTMVNAPRADELQREMEAMLERVRSEAGCLSELRAHLVATSARTDLPTAARHLRTSVRSLQRKLAEEGTTWRREIQDVRFAVLQQLLTSSDAKLSFIAEQLGVTTTALGTLVRSRTRLTLAQLRRQLRLNLRAA